MTVHSNALEKVWNRGSARSINRDISRSKPKITEIDSAV